MSVHNTKCCQLSIMLLLVAALFTPGVAAGQEHRPSRVDEPSKLLAQLASGDLMTRARASNLIAYAFGDRFDYYSDADRQLLLDGVERVARGDFDDDSSTLNPSLNGMSRLIGLVAPAVPESVRREVPTRVIRIYEETGRRSVRSAAVTWMGHMICMFPGHPDARRMLGILEDVASAPAPAENGVFADTAIEALLIAGPRGVPVLRRLNAEGRVRSLQAAAWLRELARIGFPRDHAPLADHRPTCAPTDG